MENTTVSHITEAKQRYERMADVLRTLAHPSRLAVAELLAVRGEMTVQAISEAVCCEQSLVSHHLTKMRDRGLLLMRKDGRQVFYRLSDDSALRIISCLENRPLR
jgi:DNA-binding transcriptional ArsR family regulator